eukprot:2354310-Amphidinium_carterae.3
MFGELLGQQQGGVNYRLFIVQWMFWYVHSKMLGKRGAVRKSQKKKHCFGNFLGQQQGGVNYQMLTLFIGCSAQPTRDHTTGQAALLLKSTRPHDPPAQHSSGLPWAGADRE